MRAAPQPFPWRVVRALASAGFFIGIALQLGGVSTTGVFLLVISTALLWVYSNSLLQRRRADAIYQLLAKIGDGDLAASLPDSPDEWTLRLQRGIARAQRGYGEALARAELERDELRTLVGAIQTGLLSLDAHLRIRSANEVAEKMLGLVPGSYRNKFLAEVIREPELLRFAETSLRAPAPTLREITLSQGAVEALMVAADPLRDGTGTHQGLLLALDDVTKVRRLESIRTDFAANVSHELRTPITNIKGYLETLMEIGSEDPVQTAYFLGVMHRNTARLSTLVEDILLLAFLDQPRAGARLEFAAADLLTVARDAIQQLEGVAKAKEMEVDLRIDGRLKFVGNAGLIAQALVNLISNALKFAPRQSRVVVAALLADGQIEIRVADAGPGIDPIHLPRLFERFYRVDTARSHELGGTGLGLAIVKHIAIIHGGSVAVDCPAEGGTVFTVRLPQGYLDPPDSAK
ncbi:MAG: hypothetical protein EXS01_03115 [Phycisphaerales bacterium]|nr:hypothetical protein [Phycisphaerales bacterium]